MPSFVIDVLLRCNGDETAAIREHAGHSSAPSRRLTPRELQVLRLMTEMTETAAMLIRGGWWGNCGASATARRPTELIPKHRQVFSGQRRGIEIAHSYRGRGFLSRPGGCDARNPERDRGRVDVETGGDRDPGNDALRKLMAEKDFNAFPVVNDVGVFGLVSRLDLFRLYLLRTRSSFRRSRIRGSLR